MSGLKRKGKEAPKMENEWINSLKGRGRFLVKLKRAKRRDCKLQMLRSGNFMRERSKSNPQYHRLALPENQAQACKKSLCKIPVKTTISRSRNPRKNQFKLFNERFTIRPAPNSRRGKLMPFCQRSRSNATEMEVDEKEDVDDGYVEQFGSSQGVVFFCEDCSADPVHWSLVSSLEHLTASSHFRITEALYDKRDVDLKMKRGFSVSLNSEDTEKKVGAT
jgi:hypothetical protein